MNFEADTKDFRKAAVAIHNAGGNLQKQATAGLRDIVKPFAHDVLITGASELPKRGGLAYRVAGSSITTDTSSTLRVGATLRNRQGYALGAMNAGTIRHPTFGHKPWKSQSIRVGIFTEPFDAGAPKVRAAVVARLNSLLRGIAS